MKKQLFLSSDRRVFPRIEVDLPVELKVRDSLNNSSSIIPAKVINLSENGASLLLSDNLPILSIVSLKINLPSPYFSIEAQSQVVRCNFEKDKFQCGVSFSEGGNKFSAFMNNALCTDSSLERRKDKRRKAAVAIEFTPRRKFDRRTNIIPKGKDKNYKREFIDMRRDWLSKKTNAGLYHIGQYSEQAENMKGNIENLIGVCQVPLGIAGPLKINGQFAKGDFYIPLATTEGTLVKTYSRGMHVLTKAGGVNVAVLTDQIHISPVFMVTGIKEANQFICWINNNFVKIKSKAEQTTKHGKLLSIEPIIMGCRVVLKFSYFTEDAQGLNMINKATDIACKFISEETNKKFLLRSNFSSIKKVSMYNLYKGQGKAIFADAVIPGRVLKRLLQVTPEEMCKYYFSALLSSAHSGMIGITAHASNGITALYIACGQDVADVSHSHIGIMTYEIKESENLYVSLYLPNLLVGTVGGGTGLATPQENLKILGCYGTGKAKKLAEIITAVALAGEITSMAALVNGTYVGAHEKYGRNIPNKI
ncbi:PilZ domain-containing protein [bacterium]|nr:PilZ domain-containing protein [bacterium]